MPRARFQSGGLRARLLGGGLWLVALLVLLAPDGIALAHPHAFADCKIVEDTTTPQPSPQAEMYDRVQSMLDRQFRDVGFFKQILIDGEPFPVEAVKRYSAESRNNRMV